MAKYQVYIVRKFYTPLEIEAADIWQAEEKGYEWLEEHNATGQYSSDDTYVYMEGEI